MRRYGRSIMIFTLLGSLAAVLLLYRTRPRTEPERTGTGLAITDVLGERSSVDFARVLKPRRFDFPADHGPHPAFRHEWWYFTGNLEGKDRRHFGYQLTFFRFALAPEDAVRTSRWGTRQIYLSHFALTDADGKRFYSHERLERSALGLAGAEAIPFRVWLDDWSAEGASSSPFTTRLQAAEEDAAIDLTLAEEKPIVLQGDRGMSRKGSEPGNASYYYSLPRLQTRGTIRIGARTFLVDGISWFDREWGTSVLGKEVAGWDWFALHLSDGRDVMFYRLRRRDGTADPLSSGTLIMANGTSRGLSWRELRIDVVDIWESPRDRTRYPSRWRLTIPSEGVVLDIFPSLADQELQTSVRYWEGAVQVRGRSSGKEIGGNGYVELTGYGEPNGEGKK